MALKEGQVELVKDQLYEINRSFRGQYEFLNPRLVIKTADTTILYSDNKPTGTGDMLTAKSNFTGACTFISIPNYMYFTSTGTPSIIISGAEVNEDTF